MNCPLCDSGETRVLRTIPGGVVSREHFCFSCCCRWWTDQQLRPGSVRARDMLAAGYRQATGSSSELSSSLSLGLISPDSDHTASKLSDAQAREAKLGPEVFTFPVVGDPERPTWAIRQTQDAELKAAFPDLDVPGEYRKAFAWLSANRSKRKTARGMMSFLFRWLGRVQDRGGSGPARQAVPFAVAAEEARKERVVAAKVKRLTDELAPKEERPSPRQEYMRSIGGSK